MRLLIIIGDDLLKSIEEKGIIDDEVSISDSIARLMDKYEIWVTANASFPQAVIHLRRFLSTQIPSKYFHTFSLPFTTKLASHKSYYRQIQEAVSEYTLLQFTPKLVLRMHLPEEQSSEDYCINWHRPSRSQIVSKHKTEKKKPSLAYFAPVPPAKSGIASYSAELLPYLASYYDITLVVDQSESMTQYDDITFPIMTVEAFEKEAESFDRKLYHFGNSYFHSYMWSLLKSYPGIVVLHDFFLSGLLSYEEINNGKELFWTEQLFKSHGYHALRERFHEDIGSVANRFPCNYEVLQNARGIIVHSDYSQLLASQWYTPTSLKQWQTIPHLRIAVGQMDKAKVRAQLGFSDNDLLICSFGLLNATKLNHQLLDAFLQSKLAEDTRCHLIYVGDFTCETYANDLRKQIAASPASKRIHITGWTEDEVFKQYLQSADIGVQLRAESRGETSGTVLDCMNYGLATIVNANGSMASLPKEVLCMLEDCFTNEDLTSILEELKENIDLRIRLGIAAQAFIQKEHDPKTCAASYNHAIELFQSENKPYQNLINVIASTETLPSKPKIIKEISDSIVQSTLPSIRQKQLLIDVSAIVQSDLRTGIQRVVRAQLLELIDLAPHNVRVEPVYLSSEGGLHYRYARNFACELLDIPLQIKEEPVSIQNGDIFYGLDFHWDGVIKAAQEGIFTRWATKGVMISFVIYDLLPITNPEFFPEDAAILHHQWLETIVPVSDKLICISEAVVDELKLWISTHLPAKTNKNVDIHAVHLGADIVASAHSEGMPDNAQEILDVIVKKPTFLMVGTIEPRKGYLQVLAAFEYLWERGEDVHLVIVGKEGWSGLPDKKRRTIPEIINRFKNHPQLNKNLFWFEDASDLFLEALYHQANTLIAASENEGFGLPLIEAAHYKLPIIARDIPVFREVASQSAYYFSNVHDPEVLAKELLTWLETYREGQHVPSEHMQHISWKENAQKTLDILTEEKKNMDYSVEKQESKPFEKSLHSPGHKNSIHLSHRAQEIYQTLSQQIKRGE